VRCLRPAEAIVADLAAQGILAGYPLGRHYPGMEDCLLVAVTEQRTKEEIDLLVDALAR
jgi:glycine dehydrogenase subunit 1